MLYLEDYVEMIEHVPQDIRDRLTEMRELDLHVQNALDNIETRTTDYFNLMKKSKVENPDSEYQGICSEYGKALENSTEKINIATQMEEQMQRHVRKLEAELNKFKFELEADTPGLTEELEKRSLQLDEVAQPMASSSGTSRSATSSKNIRRNAAANTAPDLSLTLTPNMVRTNSDSAFFSQQMSRSGLASPALNGGGLPSQPVFSPEHTAGFADGSFAFASTPRTGQSKNRHQSAAVAASTTSLVPHARKTPSASTVVPSATASVPVGVMLPASDSKIDVLGAALASGSAHVKKHKSKKRLKSQTLTSTLANMNVSASTLPHPSSSFVSGVDSATHSPGQVQQQQMAAAAATAQADWNAPAAVDPNIDPSEAEKLYCICNQISYGDMVACDNPTCPIEWFHYPCVNLSSEPVGKWYCPKCAPLVANPKTKKKHHHHRSTTS
ncbi:inhibitor of growth protein 3-like [Sycon ciliatum]|uniref:inhibitor of growth protein 3-like n=1 Tax=Sycon ciliatum TaxID=27933 RepID=UPI0031F7015C